MTCPSAYPSVAASSLPEDSTTRNVVTNETTMYVDLFELYREFARRAVDNTFRYRHLTE